MTPYEYKIISGPTTTPSDLEKQLNQLAEAGWEIESTACGFGGNFMFASGSFVTVIVLVLRRPRIV